MLPTLTVFPAVLHDELEKLRVEAGAESFTELTKDMHMYPDLHGTPSFPSGHNARVLMTLRTQETDRPSPTPACAVPSSDSPW